MNGASAGNEARAIANKSISGPSLRDGTGMTARFCWLNANSGIEIIVELKKARNLLSSRKRIGVGWLVGWLVGWNSDKLHLWPRERDLYQFLTCGTLPNARKRLP